MGESEINEINEVEELLGGEEVQCALPAIDNAPPTSRGHVSNKLKKQQWEEERSAQIEEDNFRLLQRMGVIMKSKRLDNEWLTTPTNFLRRIGIYYQAPKSSGGEMKYDAINNGATESTFGLSSRKSRCIACNPRRMEHKNNINPNRRMASAPIQARSTLHETHQVVISAITKKTKTNCIVTRTSIDQKDSNKCVIHR